jgi:hypothetical protein
MRINPKKKPLTLIEVLISMGLMSVVVYILFSSLLQTIQIAHALGDIKANALKTSFFYDRLLPIFSKADPNTFELKRADDDSIEKIKFSFENGLDPALIFSGKTTAEIYTDVNHDFILDINSKDNLHLQRESLLTNIKGFNWKENLPYFLSLELEISEDLKREFVFFFSDRPEKSEGFPL